MVAMRTEQLSVLSRHLIRLSEEEKSRLARELHDELGANLTAISIDINCAADELRTEHAHIAQRLGVPVVGGHTALGDATTVALCWVALQARGWPAG